MRYHCLEGGALAFFSLPCQRFRYLKLPMSLYNLAGLSRRKAFGRESGIAKAFHVARFAPNIHGSSGGFSIEWISKLQE